MTVLTDPRLLAVQPVRDALLARAERDSRRIRAAADADGQRALAAARAEADRLVAAARADGEADAAARLAVQRASTRRAARATVLEAQRAAYRELRRQASVTVRGLLDDPACRSRLVAELRRRLGAAADVRDDPGGGLVARTADGRSIDASVGALVDRALADLDLDALWTDG